MTKKKYELMVILDGGRREEELKDILDFVQKVVEDTEASDISREIWGVRELAYPIRKQSKGYYAIFRFESTGLKNKEIEGKLNINEEIFRYLLLKDESEKIKEKIRQKDEVRNKRKREEQEANKEKLAREGAPLSDQDFGERVPRRTIRDREGDQ